MIKARDLNGDGLTDIVVGTTYQTQSRLYLGTGKGAFRDVTATHLPAVPLSVGDLEFGDVDDDGDLDVVLADWGAGNNMTNDGRPHAAVAQRRHRAGSPTPPPQRMPATLIRFSWDLELADVDNDYDLDVLVSCKRCGGSTLFRNDGKGTFTEDLRALPQYTNNYEFEPMDLDGDGFLDLVTINDGEIVGENSSSRREHVFRNDGKGRFRDATEAWWPAAHNIGEDDNMVAFLDYDSDGDADFVVGSLSGPDRLLVNDGRGRLTLLPDVFDGDADARHARHRARRSRRRRPDGRRAGAGRASEGRPTSGCSQGAASRRDTAPPSITLVAARDAPAARRFARACTIARVRASPSNGSASSSSGRRLKACGRRRCSGTASICGVPRGPPTSRATTPYRVCATDAAGNNACSVSARIAGLRPAPQSIGWRSDVRR